MTKEIRLQPPLLEEVDAELESVRVRDLSVDTIKRLLQTDLDVVGEFDPSSVLCVKELY